MTIQKNMIISGAANGHLMKMHTGMNALTSGAHVTSQTTQRNPAMEHIPLMRAK